MSRNELFPIGSDDVEEPSGNFHVANLACSRNVKSLCQHGGGLANVFELDLHGQIKGRMHFLLVTQITFGGE